jgi:mono/diheme cytochrome c family protein
MLKTLTAVTVLCSSLAALASPTATAPPVRFGPEVLPIFAHQCFECHGNGKRKGGLDLSSREALLKGGKTGPGIVIGNSVKSLLIQKVTAVDPDDRMPSKGDPLGPAEIATLKNWINQGAVWDVTVQGFPPKPDVKPHPVALPPGEGNPIDRLLAAYFPQHHVKADEVVDDRRYARRVFFDAIGLAPTPAELEAFGKDSSPTKRSDLVKSLLARNEDYAENWISFWADHLRSGTTFGIDGRDININGWLLASLRDNMPYDQFVRTLIDPGKDGPRGFIDGLKMRGVVVASERTEIQAAQNISQVFLGTQLKCATCHDSFTSKWTQNELWGMASVFADEPMEIARCEIPTGRKAVSGFIFPELGTIDPKLAKDRKISRLAELVTSREDGLFARTIVNRLWNRVMGRGLVEPIDSMENPAWDADVLNWLAYDLVANHYNLKHTLELILTSKAYQMPATDDAEVTNGGPRDGVTFVFAGPRFRRITAEQYADAVCAIGHTQWKLVAPPPQGGWPTKPDAKNDAKSDRAWTHIRSPLQEALGRPDRNNVTTIRETDASTLQALQILTGPDLNTVVARIADKLIAEKLDGPGLDSDGLIDTVWSRGLLRKPSAEELKLSREILGTKMTKDSVSDLVWSVIALPEFQVLD